jgi:hypothetical protein
MMFAPDPAHVLRTEEGISFDVNSGDKFMEVFRSSKVLNNGNEQTQVLQKALLTSLISTLQKDHPRIVQYICC